MKERVKFETDIAAIWDDVTARVATLEENDNVRQICADAARRLDALHAKVETAKREIERMESADDQAWNAHSETVASLIEQLVAEIQDLESKYQN
jgi:hypothetical protein